MIALFLNPLTGAVFAVIAFVSNENVKEIERQILLGNLNGAKARFPRAKALSRISYWGGMVNVIIPYSFIFIILIVYADAFSFGVPFFYIQNQIFNCIFQQNKYWAEACDCLSVLQLPAETKIIDQQLPDIVFDTCRGLGKAYIDRQMLKQYDRS